MRRNALKNRKLKQTKKWRREKQRRSGKHLLESKRQRTIPLVSQVTLKDLSIRVRRHCVDFLVNCKDPRSKERALLQQLEDVKLLNLKPLALNAAVSANQKSRPPVRSAVLKMRTLSRTKSTSRPTHQTESKSVGVADATAVDQPEVEKTCTAITQEKNEETSAEVGGNSCSDVKSSVTSAAEQTERKTIGASLPPEVKGGLQKAADNPVISLKQYVRVSLTRLSVPQSSDAAKLSQDRRGRDVGKGASKPAPLIEKRVSRSNTCTAEGSRGLRETSKAKDDVNVLKQNTAEITGDRKRVDKGVDMQKESGEEKNSVQKEQLQVLKDKSKGQKEKSNSELTGVESKAKRLVEVRESERKVAHSEEEIVGQNNIRCIENKVKQGGALKASGSLNKQALTGQEDVVLKHARVLLSDILRKDKSLIDKKLQGDLIGRGFCTTVSKEMQSDEEMNEGRRMFLRERKMKPRAAKTKADDKQSTKGHLSKDVPVSVKTELSDRSLQLQSPQTKNEPPAVCPNPLPHRSLVSARAAGGVHPDTNSQQHTQSNIPLKKRTFRSSVEIQSEQGPKSALDQAPKKSPELSSPPVPRPELCPCSEETTKAKRESKVRVRPEVQKISPKRVTKQTFSRVLRSRANEGQRGHLLRKVRMCRLDKQDQDNLAKTQTLQRDDPAEEERAENTDKSQEGCTASPSRSPSLSQSQTTDQLQTSEQSSSEEMKPVIDFKIRLKRRRGKVWEMQNENMALKTEKREDLVTCDPFKAIMDSVSILNMEMEAARAHVQASKKSRSRLHRLKRRGERINQKQTVLPSPGVKSDKAPEHDEGVREEREATRKEEGREKLDRELLVGVQQLSDKMEGQNGSSEAWSGIRQETKVEDRFLNNCCLFESGLQQKLEPELNFNGLFLPVLKLRRKVEDIWEVDSKEELKPADLKTELHIKREVKGHVLGKQKSDFSTAKEEQPSSQRLNINAAPLKTEPPAFSLSLSPLSLSSPLNDSRTEAADRMVEKPEVNSAVRKQRLKMERTRRCGPLEPPTTCLSDTLQQIDNSLSRLSEGLCSSQTLEKPTDASSGSSSAIQPLTQSPPFATADNMLSGEPSFTNCCEDILDFQCLNFEGYYQPQNMLPSSPSDLCSLDPPTDPFSSPLSHSPSDTWTTETPYLGPPSPGNNFTNEDLQFFPGLIPSKSDSVPLECESKDAPKDRNASNPSYGFLAVGNSDPMAKDRIANRSAGMRLSKEELKAQSVSVSSKPRLFAATASSVTSQNPGLPSQQPPANIKLNTSQPKTQFNLKAQGPFHRMIIPSKTQSFPSGQPNPIRGASSQMSNRFLSPQIFSVKNVNPPDSPFNFQEKPSTVIHRVLKFQGGNQSQNLYSAPCKDSMAAGNPNITSRTLSAKSGTIEKPQTCVVSPDASQKSHISAHGCEKDVGHFGSSNNPSRSGLHFSRPTSSTSQPFSKSKMSSDKQESDEANMSYKNFSVLPRPFFFPSKAVDSYLPPQDKSLKLDKSSEKHQPCYTQQDPFDFSFGSSLSSMPQHNSPQVVHSTPPGTPAPANKNQSSASFPYGYQGPPYVLNFSGDHSLTLGLRDGVEGYPGLGSANYTYHCLMEPSGTQGRLVLEPCGPQLSNPASLGGFSGLKGQEEHCRKDMQQQCQPGENQGASHYGPVSASHSMGATKPKRVRLVVTDGTVDLDLQYSD